MEFIPGTIDYAENGEPYVIFEVEDIAFAVPVSETLGVINVTMNTPKIVLPNMREIVKCIVDIDGLLVTVVDILGSHGNMPIAGNSILVLNRSGNRIGIIVNEVHMITILAQKILENKITGVKNFIHNNKTYSVLDTNRLYIELGI